MGLCLGRRRKGLQRRVADITDCLEIALETVIGADRDGAEPAEEAKAYRCRSIAWRRRRRDFSQQLQPLLARNVGEGFAPALAGFGFEPHQAGQYEPAVALMV